MFKYSNFSYISSYTCVSIPIEWKFVFIIYITMAQKIISVPTTLGFCYVVADVSMYIKFQIILTKIEGSHKFSHSYRK